LNADRTGRVGKADLSDRQSALPPIFAGSAPFYRFDQRLHSSRSSTSLWKERNMTQHRTLCLTTTLTAMVAALALAGCNRADDGTTAGQKVDGAVAKVEQKAEEVGADVRAAGEKAKDNTAGAMDTVASKAKDALITSSVNAELAKDSQLSALRINVDTVEGRVALRGTAPDAASKDRATTLAQRVDGVKAVDNQLTVAPKG
jgi:hyperosmotically inducible periplasmic protein